MNGVAIGVILGLSAALPFELGDTIEPGLYPAQRIAHAHALARGLHPVVADDRTASRGVWIRRSITVEESTAGRLELILRASGVYTREVTTTEGEPFLYYSWDPEAQPKIRPDFRVKFVTLLKAKPQTVVDALRRTIEELEASVPEVERSHVSYDPRTAKLILRYSKVERLRALLDAVGKLDRPEPAERPRLERWRARSVKAARLANLFAERWEKEGRTPIPVVVHSGTNSLLLRLPHQLWLDARRILEEIDPPPKPKR